MTSLPEKILEIHQAFKAVGLPHAFGGALALAWCTERARGTIDIDVNVFVEPGRVLETLEALPPEVTWTDQDRTALERDGQIRIRWETTPVDLFINTTDFHAQLADRIRFEPFLGVEVPFLSCSDLAVFKAFFNRTKDWADLEAMAAVDTLDRDRVLGVLARYLGPTDERLERLRHLPPASL